MANLKEVRVRIASIKSTRQITSAMKMVSASKLRKGQNAILNLRPYEEQLRNLLNNINKGLRQDEKNVLCTAQKTVTDVLVIVMTANKGLCGTFNSNLIKRAVEHLREQKEKGYNIKLWLVGKKGEDFFKKSNYVIEECFHDLIETVSVDDSFDFARKVMQQIENGTFQRVEVVYNKFVNAARFELLVEQILPMHLESSEEEDAEEDEKFGYILEPSKKEILDELVPKVIQTYIYRILLDSFTSEQGARMTAMHKATDNATELLKNLTITYNKVRQSSITNEIVEIVGGAEALNS